MRLKRLEKGEWEDQVSRKPEEFCRLLEEGTILYFPTTPLELPQDDIDFLLAQKQADASYHKNISFRPRENRVTGVAKGDPGRRQRLLQILAGYSRQALDLLGRLLNPYAASWEVDYASFRPLEEKGRKIKFKARSDLLHVDAFPTRPTQGNRILRFFTNINPQQPRHWLTTETFESLLGQLSGQPGFPMPADRSSGLKSVQRALTRLAGSFGLPVATRSDYDEFMLAFHDYLKKNEEFQLQSPKYHWEFPPFSSWMVFTDMVPHAALSGRYALEQTLIIDRASLLLPDRSPLAVLERMCGRRLV